MSKAKHQEAPRNYWHRPDRPLHFGREQFRLSVLRHGAVYLRLDSVEAFDWVEDDKHIMSGSVSIRVPPFSPRRLDIRVGDLVTCESTPWGMHNWREVWRMRIDTPQYQLRDHVWQYTLLDDLVRLQQSKDDFKFHKDRAHPKGWTGDQVIRWLGRHYGFKVGRLPRMRHRIRKLTMVGASPLSVIGRVLRYEKIAYGSRYFVRWQNGALAILPYQRSNELLLMAGTIIDGTLTQTLPANFATVLKVVGTHSKKTGTDAKGHAKKKKTHLHVTVRSTANIKRYGTVVQKITAPDHVDSLTDLRRYGKHALAGRDHAARDLTFTHPGIPSLRRGHAIQITVTDAGIDKEIVYVKEVHHNVGQGDDYTMDVTVQFDDPFVDSDKAAAKKRRCDVIRKRSRKPTPDCPAHKATRSKTALARKHRSKAKA